MESIPKAVTKVTDEVTRAANTAVDTAKAARTQAKNAVSRAKDTANKVRNKLKRAKKCGQPNSFTAGTQVVLASGASAPIEQLQPGDAVLATDPETGRTESRQVTAAIEGSGSKQLIDLTLVGAGAGGGSPGSTSTDAGDQITATAGHPFWTARGWVEASDLQIGDRLRATSGATVEVAATSSRTVQATVYNLTVDTDHTYYIRTTNGTTALTHNTNLRATNGAAACGGEVALKSTDLGKMAHDYRMKNAVSPGQNVAVYEYETGAGPRYLIQKNIPGGLHAEERINEYITSAGIDPRSVTRIYSERVPCSKRGHDCAVTLNRYANAAITWSLSGSRRQNFAALARSMGF